MSVQPVSEQLFEQFCEANRIPWSRVDTGVRRTPDYVITLGGVRVTCEVKQIDPNAEDLRELAEIRDGSVTARYIPNRLRGKLKDVSAQLQDAARAGCPTLLVVYDNTPFKSYTDRADVVQAMFGRHSVRLSVPADMSLPSQVSVPFFGGNRGLGPEWNTAVSAIAILDGGPRQVSGLRLYHNVYAAVRLDPSIFGRLPVSQMVLPDATEVRL
jgi:hypothetical protein